MNQAANIIPNVNVPPPNMMASMGLPDVNPGSINVIGGANSRRSGDAFAKENTIQVGIACFMYLIKNRICFLKKRRFCKKSEIVVE